MHICLKHLCIGLQDHAGTQTSFLTVPDFGEVPASPELLQASAELAHAQSTAEALTEETSLLLARASASSLSLGESITEGTIADLLQAAVPDQAEEPGPLRQRSTAQAAIQTGPVEVPMRPSTQQVGSTLVIAERATQASHQPQPSEGVRANTTTQATQLGMQVSNCCLAALPCQTLPLILHRVCCCHVLLEILCI